MVTIDQSLQAAVRCLQNGGLLAYPTEAVYGLGCDPWHEEAVRELLLLKNRESTKGLILIASSWAQLQNLVEPIDYDQMNIVQCSWPGPNTWVFPASSQTPEWLMGANHTIAVRVTDHPIASALCNGFNKPIISTSANIAGQEPAKNAREVAAYFDDKIDFILEGEIGTLERPTTIRDAVTGKIYRV